MTRRLACAAAVLATVLSAGVLLPAGPALAHPFGPPPTARVAAEGRTITVDWSATPDDAVAIGEQLGVMPAGSIAAYRQESAAQVAPSAADEARLSASPLLHDYLLEHISASQDGAACEGAVPPIPDFVHAGARVVLTCPSPVSTAVLRITMLHDLNPAYRTVAVSAGGRGAEAVFTPTAPEHRWQFGADGSARPVPGGTSPLPGFETRLVAVVDATLGNPWLAIVACLLAVGVGAAHALTPGHGKAVTAAYLVGGRGRPRDAVLLGVAVAVMHTVSVLVLGLGLAVLVRTGDALPASAGDVTPGLRVAAGVTVLLLGAVLVVRQVRARRAPHVHTLPPDVAPLSRKGLVLLGAAGGLLPSPSAFLVLVTTSFSGRLPFGLLLVALFSLGLAATLTLLGLAVVRGRQAILARVSAPTQQRYARAAAVLGAWAVLAGGVVMTAAGVLAL